MTEINNSFTTDCMEGKLGLMKQKIIQHKNNQAAAWGTKGMENRTKKKETSCYKMEPQINFILIKHLP